MKYSVVQVVSTMVNRNFGMCVLGLGSHVSVANFVENFVARGESRWRAASAHYSHDSRCGICMSRWHVLWLQLCAKAAMVEFRRIRRPGHGRPIWVDLVVIGHF